MVVSRGDNGRSVHVPRLEDLVPVVERDCVILVPVGVVGLEMQRDEVDHGGITVHGLDHLHCRIAIGDMDCDGTVTTIVIGIPGNKSPILQGHRPGLLG